MTRQLRVQSGIWASTLILVFLLLVVWQVPGTIGLRHTLLVVLFPVALALFYWRRSGNVFPLTYRAPLVWLAGLTFWIVLVIVLWGVEPSLSWKEFRGQWGVALGAGLTGGLLALAAGQASEQQTKALFMTVFWALVAQVILHDVLGALYWATTGDMPFRQAPVLYVPDIVRTLVSGASWQDAFTGLSPDKFSYVNNTLAALLVAELAQRLLLQRRWLTCSRSVLLIAVFAMLLCSYWLQMRNGNVGLLLLLGVAALMMALRLVKRLGMVRVGAGILVVAMGLATLGTLMVRSDPRWLNLTQTIPVALDTVANRVWLTRDGHYPAMANGEQVDVSAYERLAWGKEGVKLVMDHPLGTGYNRNAFGDGIDLKYEQHGKARGGHAHSGIIDFTIANGIIGLGLWLGFLGALFYVGWQTFRGEQVGLGLTLMFLVSGFMGRSFVDSNIRDHVLQQFFFMTMLFYMLAVSRRQGGTS